MDLPAGLPKGAQARLAPPPPPILPHTSAPPGSEEPRAADSGAQLMAAHRHTDTLPLGSRPGKVERRRDVQRFHPTGTPVNAPTTRSATKTRPSSLGPPSSARRSLFNQRDAAKSSSDAPAQAGPPSEVPAPRETLAVPMATDPETASGVMQGDTGVTPRDPPGAPMETDREPVRMETQEDARDAPLPAGVPMRRTVPRQAGNRGSQPNPAPPDSGPGTTQGCGSAPCLGARAARGPRRRGGAACSPLCPTSARCTCQRVRPRRTHG